MPRHLLVAFTNASAGKQAEYDDWYANRHIPDALKIPGFVSARRFRLSEHQLPGMTSKSEYLVIYEIEAATPEQALAELGKRMGTPAMVLSDALAPDIVALTYSEIGKVQTAAR